MECRDAQFYLRLRKQTGDELGPDVTAALEGHLAGCSACALDSQRAMAFDRALGSAMKAVPVPPGLRERLISHVSGKQGTIRRRQAYRFGGALVAALLLVGIGLGWFSNTRPKVDGNEIVADLHDQWGFPQKSTEEWLAAQKLPNTLPLPFDYTLFVNKGFEDLKGKGRYVPVVVFRSREGEIAKVYIFRADGPFDLKTLQAWEFSNARSEIHQHHGFTYVVAYTGRDLQPFLRPAAAPGPEI
ncbi:MAG: hypothetical protein L0241_00515 [Planctomycetia bacterium]|nr:hypothetical protein [Planctomycetia bacterium]